MPEGSLAADVVVVGFGAAGACAAIEAARAGASVIVLDRFGGGGATALSGGVVYAGGGTKQQLEAGVSDSPEAMYDYLKLEVGDVVSDETLRDFCTDSVAMTEWLADQGVPFSSELCPFKTSYPTNDYYLYYSGSELAFKDQAQPAARGHRARGKGTSGRPFFEALAGAARRAGARVVTQTRAHNLVTDASGRVVGVECLQVKPSVRWAHALLHRVAAKPFLYAPKIGRMLHKGVSWLERRFSRPVTVGVGRSVILSAGGFINNRKMMKEHAPRHRGGLPLGTPGDDGSGIGMGLALGAAPAHLDRISVWRFITPPSAFISGVLVDLQGRRVCDEARYGAAIGSAIMDEHDGKAWLVIDQAILSRARRDLSSQTLWFQRLSGWYLMGTAKKAPTVDSLAAAIGVDPEGLAATLKAAADEKPLTGPFAAIDCSIKARLGFPAPMLTLGGLKVDEHTGQVLRPDGQGITGVYAAGRNAIGICSNSYVSGLSLADCVFSGRRAGRAAAR